MAPDKRNQLHAEEVQIAIDALSEGIQILSPEWRYLYVSEAVVRHGRTTREALLGRTMLECYPGIEQTELFATLQRCMDQRTSARFDNEFVYGDGSRAWFELRIEPCAEGLIILSLDITERKKMESALRRSHKLRALGQMAGSVAHDLKNLLNPISLDVELLRRMRSADERVQQVLRRIEDAIATGADTVERLRAFSRQEPEPAAEAIDLVRMTDVALRICAPRIDGQRGDQRGDQGGGHGRVTLCRELDDTPLVLGRPSELVNAVVNLVVNALDAMSAGGTITVRTGVDDGAWVEVDDDGPGMSPEVERRLFEPFFTTKAEGTGLGMAMVYASVQRHGGHVTVDTAPGRGTRIRMTFPLAEPAADTSVAPAGEARAGRRVLVVEDAASARKALELLLVEEGFGVHACASAEDALAQLPSFEPDLLLVDLRLPGINGIALARRAREQRGVLPVLLMSGIDESDDEVAEWLRGPHSAHIPKPLQLDRLMAELDRLLDELPRSPA
jgi:signal transduction histidine kinase/ActR/RegA family two-component response regulator